MVSYRSLHFIHMGHPWPLHNVLGFDWVIQPPPAASWPSLAHCWRGIFSSIPSPRADATVPTAQLSSSTWSPFRTLAPRSDPIVSSAQGTSRPGPLHGAGSCLVAPSPRGVFLHTPLPPCPGLAAQALQGTQQNVDGPWAWGGEAALLGPRSPGRIPPASM